MPEPSAEKPWQVRARARESETLAARVEAGRAFKAQASKQFALLRPVLEDIRCNLHEVDRGKLIPQQARKKLQIILSSLRHADAIVRNADAVYERWLRSNHPVGPVGGEPKDFKPIEGRVLPARGAKRPQDRKGKDKHK
ncbi:MAG: hypothetical protein IT437_10470 [Phycisphaerales bacterium]|nr:hypothetical protein [Phycisphaerales bacterium]